MINSQWLRRVGSLFFAGALTLALGCESVALLPRKDIAERSYERRGGDRSGGDRIERPGEVFATVQDINQRRGEIRLRTEDGRTMVVKYDTNTRFYDGNRVIRADLIRSGDRVSVRFDRDSGVEQYANAIRVEDRRDSRSY